MSEILTDEVQADLGNDLLELRYGRNFDSAHIVAVKTLVNKYIRIVGRAAHQALTPVLRPGVTQDQVVNALPRDLVTASLNDDVVDT